MIKNNGILENWKGILKRMKTTLWNWKNSSKNSMSNVASEMLKNILNLNTSDKMFLKIVSEYKNHRISLVRFVKYSKADSSSIRSFRIRILMGLY